ncbi:hypothetical protein VOI54_11135 [Tamlana sp. 2201CG12-4]|uniref:hypothetical protein n=1 Tax=Tamlana sp. 2201CG12-4 TaxID=3112582 RepID=UPI002DB87372|nr:hypothetical protein [Tamlana sp. 2201CG12-4]MEC3907574.1 hypothetical protein [Tamlana sp. 2201CG12-4]
MKNYYLLFFLFNALVMYGQTNCDDANSYLVNAYSHVKDAYDANNISHLKYYANRSVESFKLAKTALGSCNCKTALDLTDKGIEFLSKVEGADTFEDGRFFVKRGREVAKESVIEIDKCAFNNFNSETVSSTTLETSALSNDSELSDLQKEQLKLRQQQEALRLKEAQIKSKLAEQKEKALLLKKKNLILSYEHVLTNHISTYNETLKVCGCNHQVFKEIQSNEGLSSKSIDDIKSHFTNNLKLLASSYLSELNKCN